MNPRSVTICFIASVLLVCVSLTFAQEAGERVVEPPPDDACEVGVITHVLTDTISDWRRVTDVIVGDPVEIPGLTERDLELLAIYEAVCGASVAYADPASERRALVTMIAFTEMLQASGFFTAYREEDARRVLVTSPAFRNEAGRLHVVSGYYYIRVEVPALEEDALPPDRYIASGLEVRLPKVPDVPRLFRLMPWGWVNEMTMTYAPTEIFGEQFTPFALEVERELGFSHIAVQVIDLGTEIEALERFTTLLEQAVGRGATREVRGIGQEAYLIPDGVLSMVMRQDEFVGHLTGDVSRPDAEAVMRLIGIGIRITRPLPPIAPDREIAPPADLPVESN